MGSGHTVQLLITHIFTLVIQYKKALTIMQKGSVLLHTNTATTK